MVPIVMMTAQQIPRKGFLSLMFHTNPEIYRQVAISSSIHFISTVFVSHGGGGRTRNMREHEDFAK